MKPAECTVAVFLSLLVFVLWPSTAQGQSSSDVNDAVDSASSSAASLERVGLSRGYPQGIRFDANTNGVATASLQLNGVRHTLLLERRSVRSPDFRLLVQRTNGELTEHPLPPVVTYRGTVQGDAESRVGLTWIDGRATGAIRLGDGTVWFVQPVLDGHEPLDRDRHFVYRREDVIAGRGVCGNDQMPLRILNALPQRTPTEDYRSVERSVAIGGAPLFVEVAFDTDFEFFELNGRSVAATLTDIESIMNGLNVIYQAEFGLEHIITSVIVRTTKDDPYTQLTFSDLLWQMRSHWIVEHQNIRRDVVHLMIGRGLFDEAVGIAWIGTVCDDLAEGFSYGVSQSRFSENFSFRVGLTAHELGHNWDADHCDGDADCSIMCSSINQCSGNVFQFGAVASASIEIFRDSAGCLEQFIDVVYVDDDSVGESDGTLDRPFATVAEGLESVLAGGVIIVSDGNYPESLNITVPVTLRTYLGRSVIGR